MLFNNKEYAKIIKNQFSYISWSDSKSAIIIQLLLPAEFSRPVSAMCENHDGLSHRSISEQRRLHSPSVDEQETELEPSLEQDEEDQGQGQEDKDYDGNITPSRKKEIMVVKIP